MHHMTDSVFSQYHILKSVCLSSAWNCWDWCECEDPVCLQADWKSNSSWVNVSVKQNNINTMLLHFYLFFSHLLWRGADSSRHTGHFPLLALCQTHWLDRLCAVMHNRGEKQSFTEINLHWENWTSFIEEEEDTGSLYFCAALSGIVPFMFYLRFCHHQANPNTCHCTLHLISILFIYPAYWLMKHCRSAL